SFARRLPCVALRLHVVVRVALRLHTTACYTAAIQHHGSAGDRSGLSPVQRSPSDRYARNVSPERALVPGRRPAPTLPSRPPLDIYRSAPLRSVENYRIADDEVLAVNSARTQKDALRGSLDLLILKTLSLGPMHGWG